MYGFLFAGVQGHLLLLSAATFAPSASSVLKPLRVPHPFALFAKGWDAFVLAFLVVIPEGICFGL